jgi:type I restriction enzyme R subunit
MPFQITEADTCRTLVMPKLREAGWEEPPHLLAEQHYFTDGRIVIVGRAAKRRQGKRADYILRYTRDLPLAVVEAKAESVSAGEGMQQAKDYALILGLKYAYATNGRTILEFDFFTGLELELDRFPTPAELWVRYQTSSGLTAPHNVERYLTPLSATIGKHPRYYQEIAINRTVEALLSGRKRLLLTMATGTGKTMVAFQICWKLWNARWNLKDEHRRPRILFLADRNILVDDPKDKTFAVFGDARWKIENGEANKGRELYFSTYQAIAEDERRPGLYREYASDFFDLIIIDECHRGSARDTSSWRSILEHFEPACQLGLTATPFREESRNTYAYFGASIYEYSLRQGIEDGFLAPYRIHRVITTFDAAGWRPTRGQLDRYGQAIPDEEYHTKDFERIVSLRARTEKVARHLTDYLKRTDRFAKTLVFCVDQEHADDMRRALANLNSDLVQQYPEYVCRVTSADGDIGKGALSRYQELETQTPTILTTSQLLTTGVDAPTTKNVVLMRVINSMSEFKQIIGRGTRVRQDYGKLYFDILDYTGSATRLFADPEFDGKPAEITEEQADNGILTSEVLIELDPEQTEEHTYPARSTGILGTAQEVRRKFYVDGGCVEIAAHLVYELDADGQQLRVIQLTDYTSEKVRMLYRSPEDLATAWCDPYRRADVLAELEERGINYEELVEQTGRSDADLFDLLCHITFDRPLLTRRERTEKLRRNSKDFFDQYSDDARAVLNALLEKYADYGIGELKLPDTFKLPPLSNYGTIPEIATRFGGAEKLSQAVSSLQTLLYSN